MDSIDPAVGGAGNVAVAVADYVYRPLTTKHRRAGSTGTTGDEEYTTDEEDGYAEEVERPGATAHPILKSDLARAATDLFGYQSKDRADRNEDEDEDDEEPTGLFDEEDANESRTSYGPGTPGKRCAKVPHPRGPGKDHLLVRDSQRPRESTNPFYASLRIENSSPSPRSIGVKVDTDLPEFLTCTRRPGVSNSSGGSLEETTGNPFRSSSWEDDEGGPKIGDKEPKSPKLSNFPTAQVAEIVKSEVETRSREALDEPISLAETEETESNCARVAATKTNWEKTIAEAKEHAIAKLEDELRRAHEELKLKDEEVTRLSRIRQDVETELEDLTASLFQEAHNMVRQANVRQATAERLLAESRMKSEVLAAEVAALKTLVLTSTPARPNPHLHPQIDGTRGRDETPGGIFAKRGHRRSPSHFNLKYGRENSPPESPVKEQRPSLPAETGETPSRDGLEVDPIVHKEFLQWKLNPCVDKADPFVKRVFREDIDLCLDFANEELGAKVRQAVLDGIVFVEAVSDKTKVPFPKKCALLEAPRQCHYRMRLSDQENQWYSISQICRNRIIAVCDFLNYLRYIERGLVKSSVHDIYWEITRLRKEMVLARLGLALSS